VSNAVVAPHVWMVAVPDTAGVHWKTRSGAPPLADAQLPACALAPLVVATIVPPCAGRSCGLAHVPVAGVVVDEVDVLLVLEVELLVEDVDVLVVVIEVDDVDVLLVVELEEVDVLLDDVVDVLVREVELLVEDVDELVVLDEATVVVVVFGAPGTATVNVKFPLDPPHDPA